ncbi:MAG: cupin domain-containing protein [Vicinamibacterales bacterium]
MARAALHRWDEIPLEKVTEMVARKAVTGRAQSLVQLYVKKGALVPRHEHAGEQLIYVLQGALRVTAGRETFTVREGELLQVPARLAHQAEALDDTFLLDLRAPGPDPPAAASEVP